MKRRMIGTVESDKSSKTRRVVSTKIFRHRKYIKSINKQYSCLVHDACNVSSIGDVVEVIECRPMSRLKRWWITSVY